MRSENPAPTEKETSAAAAAGGRHDYSHFVHQALKRTDG
jgi:hypothetical protein